MNITINNQNFILHHYGSVFWVEKSILLLSDLHLGKVAHFRKNGFAIPNNVIHENFNKLNALIEKFLPQKIIFLGDLFHSTINTEWNLFSEWAKTIKQEVLLVEGNHDIIATSNYKELHIKVVDELLIDAFYLTHHPAEKDELFNFCGHIHPCVKLHGLGKQFLKIPCFFTKKNQMILPAFGEFTGNYTLVPNQGDLIYGITKDKVIEVFLK